MSNSVYPTKGLAIFVAVVVAVIAVYLLVGHLHAAAVQKQEQCEMAAMSAGYPPNVATVLCDH